MKHEIIVRCEKCRASSFELICRYLNRDRLQPTSKTVCVNCGCSSSAMGFLTGRGEAFREYVAYHYDKQPIKCSIGEYEQWVTECVKRQIVQSCLFDENNNIIDRKDEYYEFS